MRTQHLIKKVFQDFGVLLKVTTNQFASKIIFFFKNPIQFIKYSIKRIRLLINLLWQVLIISIVILVLYDIFLDEAYYIDQVNLSQHLENDGLTNQIISDGLEQAFRDIRERSGVEKFGDFNLVKISTQNNQLMIGEISLQASTTKLADIVRSFFKMDSKIITVTVSKKIDNYLYLDVTIPGKTQTNESIKIGELPIYLAFKILAKYTALKILTELSPLEVSTYYNNTQSYNNTIQVCDTHITECCPMPLKSELYLQRGIAKLMGEGQNPDDGLKDFRSAIEFGDGNTK